MIPSYAPQAGLGSWVPGLSIRLSQQPLNSHPKDRLRPVPLGCKARILPRVILGTQDTALNIET